MQRMERGRDRQADRGEQSVIAEGEGKVNAVVTLRLSYVIKLPCAQLHTPLKLLFVYCSHSHIPLKLLFCVYILFGLSSS